MTTISDADVLDAIMDIIKLLRYSESIEENGGRLAGFTIPSRFEQYAQKLTDDPRITVPVILTDEVKDVGLIICAA